MFRVTCFILFLQNISVWSFFTTKCVIQVNHGTRLLTSAIDTKLYAVDEDEYEEYDDPYGDLFNFRKPIEETESAEMLNIWSIDAKNVDADATVLVRKPPKTAQQAWPNWDAFMEQEFGNMDAVLSEGDMWQMEMRDSVELKRGNNT